MTSQNNPDPWTIIPKPAMDKPMTLQEQQEAMKRIHQEQLRLLKAGLSMSADQETETTVTSNTETRPEGAGRDSNEDIEVKKVDHKCICPAHPEFARKDTADSVLEVLDDNDYRPRPRRRGRRSSFSPVRIIREHSIPPPNTVMVSSSAALLEKVNNYDGVADLPFPARSSAYLTTFPFTNSDVQKFAWLFQRGVEETWMRDKGRDDRDADRDRDDFDEYDNYDPYYRRGRRARSPYYVDGVPGTDIPSVYLSRVLDRSFVPHDEEELDGNDVKYWIAIQNRSRNPGIKLMVAESRPAAGIMIYHEALSGNSVGFVGAVVGVDMERKKMKHTKFKMVESLEAASEVEEGVVGIVC